MHTVPDYDLTSQQLTWPCFIITALLSPGWPLGQPWLTPVSLPLAEVCWRGQGPAGLAASLLPIPGGAALTAETKLQPQLPWDFSYC